MSYAPGAAILALVSLSSFGCSGPSGDPEPRGVERTVAAAVPSESTESEEENGDEEPQEGSESDLFRPSKRRATLAGAREATQAATAANDEAQAAAEQPPPRDLGAELRAAVGDPSPCVQGSTDSITGERLVFDVDATVTALGRVTRAVVTSSAPDEVNRCVRQRIESQVLRAPIEDAPTTIHTTIELTRRAP